MKVMLSTQVEQVLQQEPPHTLAPSHEAAQLAMMLGEFAGLEKSLTAQLAVNAATKVNPALKPAADELKTAFVLGVGAAIAQTNVAEDAFLNPTQIGEVVGMPNQFAITNSQFAVIPKYQLPIKNADWKRTNYPIGWARFLIANCELRIDNCL
jgi:hypothetical protein